MFVYCNIWDRHGRVVCSSRRRDAGGVSHHGYVSHKRRLMETV